MSEEYVHLNRARRYAKMLIPVRLRSKNLGRRSWAAGPGVRVYLRPKPESRLEIWLTGM